MSTCTAIHYIENQLQETYDFSCQSCTDTRQGGQVEKQRSNESSSVVSSNTREVLDEPPKVSYSDSSSGITVYTGHFDDVIMNEKNRTAFLKSINSNEVGHDSEIVSSSDLSRVLNDIESKYQDGKWKKKEETKEVKERKWRSLKELRRHVSALHNPYRRTIMTRKKQSLLRQLWTANTYRWCPMTTRLPLKDRRKILKRITGSMRVPRCAERLALEYMSPSQARQSRELMNAKASLQTEVDGIITISKDVRVASTVR